MGLNWAEHTIEIAAPIQTCFDAITDYETFPAWQRAVVDTEVLDWDGEGRGKRVRLFIDAKVRKVDYTLEYRYDPPGRIEWDFVEGNGISGADGHYLFEDLGDRTRATYKLGLEVALPLPGPVARRAHRSTLKASVEDLKREAERRAAGRARPSSAEPSSAGRSAPLADDTKAPPTGAATEMHGSPAESNESIREAAGEAASALVNLGVVAASKTVGRPARRAVDVAGAVRGRATRVLRRVR